MHILSHFSTFWSFHIYSKPSQKVGINRQKRHILAVLEAFMKSEKIQNLRRYRKENSKIWETFLDYQSETLEFFSSLDITFHLKMYKFKRHKIVAFLRIFRRISAHFVCHHHGIKYIDCSEIGQNWTKMTVFTWFVLKSERGRMWGDAENKIQNSRKFVHTRMLRQ